MNPILPELTLDKQELTVKNDSHLSSACAKP